jgi:hypothetical protein
VFVPFFGLDLPITNVACENATIVPRVGLLCLLTNQSGFFKVVLDFDIPTSLIAARGDTISLRLAPTAAGQLEIGNVPAGKRILVEIENPRFGQELSPQTCLTDAGGGGGYKDLAPTEHVPLLLPLRPSRPSVQESVFVALP